MLAAQLQKNIDEKWTACWPVSSLKPLVLLDLLSYLLFIKYIEDRGIVIETRNTGIDLTWTNLKNIDPQSLQQLFTGENGIPKLLRNYGDSHLIYGRFIREPLMANPRVKLLSNIRDIIEIMEAQSKNTKAAIFEYLLYKTEIDGNNGEAYTPEYIIKLIVALMKPGPSEFILDFSARNGSFLVNSIKYIDDQNATFTQHYRKELNAKKYRGYETDPILLRLAAMNMILHGIEDPELEQSNLEEATALHLNEKPSLILSNLFSEDSEYKAFQDINTKPADNRKDISLLNLILESMNSNCRCAIIIRENVLYNTNLEDVKALRKKVIDEYNLIAVISLLDKNDPLYGSCILIFHENKNGTTEGVWFHKIHSAISKHGANSNEYAREFSRENIAAQEIINCWKYTGELATPETENYFYVPVNFIRSNQYTLSFNQYKTILHQLSKPNKKSEDIAAINSTSSFAKSSSKQEDNRVITASKSAGTKAFSSPVKIKASKKIISLMVLAVIAIIVIYSLFFRNKNQTAADISTLHNIAVNDTQQERTVNTLGKKKSLSNEEIKKILKDTSGIITFNDKPSTADPAIDSVTIPGNNLPKKDLSPNSTETEYPGNLHLKYIVTDTAFFHDLPDKRTARKSFLDPLNKNIVTPLQDKDGFIFITYTNHFGRTSKGWIDKKDLEVYNR